MKKFSDMLYANLIRPLIECQIKASTQGGTARPISSAKIRIFLQTYNINKLKIQRKEYGERIYQVRG